MFPESLRYNPCRVNFDCVLALAKKRGFQKLLLCYKFVAGFFDLFPGTDQINLVLELELDRIARVISLCGLYPTNIEQSFFNPHLTMATCHSFYHNNFLFTAKIEHGNLLIFNCLYFNFIRFNRSELLTTLTELNAIANDANIGFNCHPVSG